MSSPFAKASDVVFISLVTTVASTCSGPDASNSGYIYGEGTVLQRIKCENAKKVRRRQLVFYPSTTSQCRSSTPKNTGSISSSTTNRFLLALLIDRVVDLSFPSPSYNPSKASSPQDTPPHFLDSHTVLYTVLIVLLVGCTFWGAGHPSRGLRSAYRIIEMELEYDAEHFTRRYCVVAVSARSVNQAVGRSI